MSITWPEKAEAKPAPAFRLRLMSFAVAGALCAGVTYLAMTQQFGVIADLMDENGAVTSIVEDKQDPPPPRVLRDPPPLPPTIAPIDTTAPLTPIDLPVTPEPPVVASSILTNATFLERPNARDFERYYPERALARGQGGRVVLDCLVGASGRLSCRVDSEDPVGMGFGEASLRAAEHFRVAPATADGRPTSDGRLRVPMTWRAQ